MYTGNSTQQYNRRTLLRTAPSGNRMSSIFLNRNWSSGILLAGAAGAGAGAGADAGAAGGGGGASDAAALTGANEELAGRAVLAPAAVGAASLKANVDLAAPDVPAPVLRLLFAELPAPAALLIFILLLLDAPPFASSVIMSGEMSGAPCIVLSTSKKTLRSA